MSTSQENSMTPTGPRRDYIIPSDHSGPVYFDNPRWMDEGNCASTDPELFFPEMGGATRSAKRVCMSCPVIAECLEYALDHNERFGVWGGVSEKGRRSLRKGTAA